MDFLKSLPIKEIAGAIITVVSVVWGFIQNHRDDIAALIKRVEADSQDGWTKEEKLKLFWELFDQKLYPTLPWYIKMLPKAMLKSQIEKVLDGIISKAKAMKSE